MKTRKIWRKTRFSESHANWFANGRALTICAFVFAMLAAFSLASCSDDEDEDRVEQVTLYVSAETSIYYDLFDSRREHPVEGMLIREKGETRWSCVSFMEISGFTYEHELLVKKTTLANPPQDASNIRYELIRIVSQRAV